MRSLEKSVYIRPSVLSIRETKREDGEGKREKKGIRRKSISLLYPREDTLRRVVRVTALWPSKSTENR